MHKIYSLIIFGLLLFIPSVSFALTGAAVVTVNDPVIIGGNISVDGSIRAGSRACDNEGGGISDGELCNCCTPNDINISPYWQTCQLASAIYEIKNSSGTVVKSGTLTLGSPQSSPEGCHLDCGDFATVCSQTRSFSFSSSGLAPGNYTVTVTSTDCRGTNTGSKSFTIYPTLTASCSANPPEQFVNEDVIWMASISGGDAGVTPTYSWSGDLGLSGSESTTAPKKYSPDGTYKARVTVTSGSQTAVSPDCSVKIKPAEQAVVTGYHDGAMGVVSSESACKANGWATYSGDTTIDLDIRILKDGSELLVVEKAASLPRGDLTGVCSGGTCAFDIALAGYLSDGISHQITAQARHLGVDNNAWKTLSTSPKSLTCPQTVTVSYPPDVTLTASPNPVAYNTASTLTWTVAGGATSCTATGAWSGSKSVTGGSASTGNLTSAKTYNLTCSNAYGNASASVTVNVNAQQSTTGTIVVSSKYSDGTSAPTTWTITGPATLTQSSLSSGRTYTSQPTGGYTIGNIGSKSGYTYAVTPLTSDSLSSGGTLTFNITYTATPPPPPDEPDGGEPDGGGGDNPPGGGGTVDITCPVTATVGQVANFSVGGGNTGVFTWTASGSPTPSSKTGNEFFSTTWLSGAGTTATVTVVDSGGSDNCSVEIINSTPDFTISVSDPDVYLPSGVSGSHIGPTFTVTPYNGFDSRVYFRFESVTPAIPGMDTSNEIFNPEYLDDTGGTYYSGTVMTLSFSSAVPDGDYIIKVRGRKFGGGNTKYKDFNLHVAGDGTPPDEGPGVIPPFEEF